MKRKIAIFLAAVCLLFYCADISALAEGYIYCPYCAAKLIEQGEHLGHWTEVRTFTDDQGKSVECREVHSLDRIYKICPSMHKCVWSQEKETVTHSLSECPYK